MSSFSRVKKASGFSPEMQSLKAYRPAGVLLEETQSEATPVVLMAS